MKPTVEEITAYAGTLGYKPGNLGDIIIDRFTGVGWVISTEIEWAAGQWTGLTLIKSRHGHYYEAPSANEL